MTELIAPTGVSKKTNLSFWDKLGQGIDFLSTTLGTFSGYIMTLAAVLICYDVFMRFVFKKPAIWVFDVTSYIFIWYGFLTAAYGLKVGSHINVDILLNKMKPRIKIPLETIAYTVCFIYSTILLIYVFKMTVEAYLNKEAAPTVLHAPMYIVELGILIGYLALSFQTLRMLIEKIRVCAKGNLEGGTGFINNPVLILPLYLILSALGIYLYVVTPGIGMVVTILVLLLAGVPVFAALGIVGSLGLFILMGTQTGLTQTAFVALKSLDNFTLLAIPLYILVGEILISGGIAHELYDACATWVGHFPGGIAVATVIACGIFAAISGSSVATAAAIGAVALPEMLERGYDKRLAYGILAAGGTLGILIPPSGAMIIYSSVTDESTGALFVGGIIPGIILCTIFSLFAILYCMRTGRYQKVKRATWEKMLEIFKTSFWGLMTPVIIIISIYSGVCTPTEAAAIAVVYALIVSLLRRKIKFRELHNIVKKSTHSSTMILMIVVGAMLLGTITTFLQIPQQALELVNSLQVSKWLILSMLCVFYLILGMFLEVVSILLITMPIVYPLIINLGFNGIWFGVFVTVLMEMALITPPVGLNIYVIQGVANASMVDVVRGVLPFLLFLFLALFLLVFFPQLSLLLPSIMI